MSCDETDFPVLTAQNAPDGTFSTRGVKNGKTLNTFSALKNKYMIINLFYPL